MIRFAQLLFLVGALTACSRPAPEEDILFIGNSFTFGAEAPVVQAHGGVPKLFEEIARAKGRNVTTFAVTAGGQDWSFHLAQPVTQIALSSRKWTWVVLQDFSLRPTHVGNIGKFLEDGETFSSRIAATSPRAGILLYETWARPAGAFYENLPGRNLVDPAQMMAELHHSYGQLCKNLAAENPNRPARDALVGTAFARCKAVHPEIKLDATDQHHATAEGYYLAALVMYETIYHDSAKGAPTKFFDGEQFFASKDAAALQAVADEVVGLKVADAP